MSGETMTEWQARWWAEVSGSWEDLRALVERWHPESPALGPRPLMPITARNAEGARLELLLEDQEATTAARLCGDLLERMDATRAKQDHEALFVILNAAWLGIPESSSCWAIPGFDTLCDLCSDPPPSPDESATPVAGEA